MTIMGNPHIKPLLFGIALVAVACMTIIALVLSLVTRQTVDPPYLTQYGMVFDAGSTHTSLFLYQWPGNKENNTGVVSQKLTCDVKGDGISSYVTNPPGAGQSLRECLDVALATVPDSQRRMTPVYLGATAGMRLLSLQNQTQADIILAEVAKTIQSYPFDFRGARIISGMEEGAYGWITINYLLEGFIKYTFDGKWIHPKAGRILGAMDLGGASTQISFTPKYPVEDPNTAIDLQLYGFKFELYTHSYLCYGKDQALKRIQARLQIASPSTVVFHPCYPSGYNLTVALGNLYDSPCVSKPVPFDPSLTVTFMGSGNSQECSSEMNKLVNLSNCALFPDCGFNGVYQPPVNGEFYLQSQYPKVKEKYLRDYCASAHYIMTILLKGYKFNATWDQIYFVKQVADNDIGWTLGYMLNLTNLIPSERPLAVTGVQHSQWAAEVFFIVFALFLSLLILIVLCIWNPDSQT
uniref:Ectonucleoside triphosphate diphosphohydrolase 8 n=1 Tax=Pygocentrus nattereri TaxID=42514 RepID=A0AAR2IZ99_PYGNA